MAALQTQSYGVNNIFNNYHNHNQNQRVMRRIMKPRDPRPCPHLWFLDDSCLNCGMRLQSHGIRLLPYSKFQNNTNNKQLHHLDTTITSSLTTNVVEIKRSIKSPNDKKMCLVLDLDHTLLNSTPLTSLSLEEDYLRKMTPRDALKYGLYRIEHMSIMTKIRPFVRTFLDEASKMYELYIYTMGDRPYALEMAKLLDPQNKYFNSRIISRDDCKLKHQKSLNVLQKPENSVVIVDDTPGAWPNNKGNLIVVDRYMYFSYGCQKMGYQSKSLAELKRDENELDGALSSILHVLKTVHRDYSKNEENVKQVLQEARRRVLGGCKLVFSGVVSKNCEASSHGWWKMAEELGATCVREVESSVTHVVSVDGRTEKSRWGVEQGRFVVHPRWVESAYYLWRRMPEHHFQQLNITTRL